MSDSDLPQPLRPERAIRTIREMVLAADPEATSTHLLFHPTNGECCGAIGLRKGVRLDFPMARNVVLEQVGVYLLGYGACTATLDVCEGTTAEAFAARILPMLRLQFLHAENEKLWTENDRLRAERDKLAAFARAFIAANAWDDLGEWDGGDVQEVAERMGLLVPVPGGYDPAKHGCAGAEEWGAEKGDPYYEFAPFVRRDDPTDAGNGEGAPCQSK